MRREVLSAVDFLSNILRTHDLTAAQLERFRVSLTNLLCDHYADHWFPERPNKGSGYRCLRINHKMDPIISRAGERIGLSESKLFTIFPSEFTVWVDPNEVSYRIGEEGSIGVLFEELAQSQNELNESYSSVSSPQQHQQLHSHSSHESSPSPVDNIHGDLNFFQACKDQLRHYLPENDHPSAINLEYLTSFVAS